MLEYFNLNKERTKIYDEEGEETGYVLHELKIPENYPNVLNGITITIDGEKHRYGAIPILNKPQVYHIKPLHVGGNINFVKEMEILKQYADEKTKESVDEFIFYNINGKNKDERLELKSKFDILSYLGYIQFGKSLTLGRYVSESGITRFKPMFERRKSIVPSQFKNPINKINHNSWILTVLYSLDYWFVDEKNRKYLNNYGVGIHFKDAVDKLIELGYLFKNNGKIYDVYTLFDLFDFSYTGFIHEAFDLGATLDEGKLKTLFEKYQINFDVKKETFAKLFANIVSYYISNRFEELLDDPDGNKASILRFLGLDYKG